MKLIKFHQKYTQNKEKTDNKYTTVNQIRLISFL